ncbi:TRAP transporter small permease [Telmatospirillum sp. J64-1]|uniref:TRAP transporter small permease n=1 Tax=Telmatospirillum sp. J64-1 TaxID=2502183 RepID=UPI00115DE5F8|nr:TRAP transporter small permease subunit [Telmatospirillum sp. J64-1]
MKIVAAAYDVLVAALAVLAGVAIMLAFVLIVFEVSLRGLGIRPPAFPSAMVEYLLLYFALLPAPYLVRKKGHVYIDAIVVRVPAGLRRVLEYFSYITCIGICLLFAYIGYLLAADAIRFSMIDQRAIDLPLYLLYLPFPIVFTMVAIEFARFLFGSETMYVPATQPKESL